MGQEVSSPEEPGVFLWVLSPEEPEEFLWVSPPEEPVELQRKAIWKDKLRNPLWRDKLRNPGGKELPPAIYRGLKLDEICTSESDMLLFQLAALGASTPLCVCSAKVPKKQAKIANGRFTFSAGSPGARHIAEIFTDHELDRLVHDGDKFRSREMPVFDREGGRYDFEFMYSEHEFYRLAGPDGEFERFMVDNNVVRDIVELDKRMIMQIFAFRSSKLLPKNEGFHDHPDGALAMIILFSEDEDTDSELDDDLMAFNELTEKYPVYVEPEGYPD